VFVSRAMGLCISRILVARVRFPKDRVVISLLFSLSLSLSSFFPPEDESRIRNVSDVPFFSLDSRSLTRRDSSTLFGSGSYKYPFLSPTIL
jgi:hypothetical protein